MGLACLDLLILWRSARAAVDDNAVADFQVQGGGMVATALAAVSRLGGRAEFWGAVGADWAADLILRGLQDEGVDVRCVHRDAGRRGPLVLVNVDQPSGERSFQIAWRVPEPAEPVGDLANLRAAGCLLVDDTRPRSAVRAAAEARRLGVPVVGDLGRVGPGAGPLSSLVDYAIVSEHNLRREALGDDVEGACRAISAAGPRCVVVTRGAEGLVAFDGRRLLRRPAFAVEVVDTTGAGDVFHGAFCYGLVQGFDLEANLTFASAAAALKCRALGGRAGIPTMAEVLRFLRERGIAWSSATADAEPDR